MNENGHVVRNKEIIVFIGSAQDKGIYFQESFSPISTLESIKKIWSFVCLKNLKIYRMDVKSTFLNGNLVEEVCIE